MSTPPILSNTMQANVKGVATSKNTQNPDAEATLTSPLFGDVLARQISESKNIIEIKSEAALAGTVHESDTDEDSAQVIRSDMATPTTTDLLPTLLPQPATTLTVADTAQTVTTEATQPVTTKPVAGVPLGADTNSVAPAKASFGTDELGAASAVTTRPASTIDKQTEPVFTQKQLSNINGGSRLSARDLTESIPATQPPPPGPPTATALQSLTNLSSVPMQDMPLVMQTPLNQGRWADEFSQKVTWLVSSNQDQHAELHLNPPQLGPLDVVLKVSGDQASAMFTSSHASVREAIELSIPKLREMLADNGFTLGSATVSDQTPREQRGDLGYPRHSTENGHLTEVSKPDFTLPKLAPVRRHIGVVDTFA